MHFRVGAMKGQMFLIAGIILLLGIITLANIMNIYSVFEEMRHTEASDMNYRVDNIAREYEYMISAMSSQSQINSNNIRSFTENITQYEDEEIFFLLAYANNSDYTMWAGNYLKDSINFTANMSYSIIPDWNIFLDDKSVSFIINNATITDIEINISYTLNNENEKQSLPMRITNNSIIGFFDVRLNENDNFAKKRIFVNRTW